MNTFEVLPMVEIALIDGSKAADNIVVGSGVGTGCPLTRVEEAATS